MRKYFFLNGITLILSLLLRCYEFISPYACPPFMKPGSRQWCLFLRSMNVAARPCRWPRWDGRWSRITVDLDTKCIKVADASQTIWLIRSHSGASEQGVEGRDRWHNSSVKQPRRKRPGHLWWQSRCHQSHYKPPFSHRNKHSFTPKKGESQLSGESHPLFPPPLLCVGGSWLEAHWAPVSPAAVCRGNEQENKHVVLNNVN